MICEALDVDTYNRLLNYGLYQVGVSGGKDSTAMLLWLRFESGLPLSKMQICFNETDNEDPLTYAYLAMLSEVTGLPIRYVDSIGFWELARKKKRFPSRKARFCTQHLKVIPSMKLVQELQQAAGELLIMSGVRRAEGKAHNDRGDLEWLSHDDSYGADKFLPIYEWSIEEVWAIHKRYLSIDYVLGLIESDPSPHFDTMHPAMPQMSKREYLLDRMKRHGIPRNPLYDMGARRVGCFPCINSRKLEIRAMDIYRPERVDFIESQEGSLGREQDDGTMYSSFFARNTVPERHRSKAIITAKGEEMNVATIRDVTRWSRTAHGGKQFNFDFAAFEEDPPLACDARGMCE